MCVHTDGDSKCISFIIVQYLIFITIKKKHFHISDIYEFVNVHVFLGTIHYV